MTTAGQNLQESLTNACGVADAGDGSITMTVSADGRIRDICAPRLGRDAMAEDIVPILLDLHKIAHSRAIDVVRSLLASLDPGDGTTAAEKAHAPNIPAPKNTGVESPSQRDIDADDEYFPQRHSSGRLTR
ncbi:YbaB/EbfC family nucleoid-associated protein [Nocardia sp. NPDC127606]|uniref:YbaB/EbfC family nucleoid-associated protein n=1 Tax=Nocardia sp. NPDC127606 TaxID=3345406 RepID=UPI0036385456